MPRTRHQVGRRREKSLDAEASCVGFCGLVETAFRNVEVGDCLRTVGLAVSRIINM